MGRLSGPSPLLPGETSLHTQKWLRLVSSKTSPGYRIAHNLWPLWTIRLVVTDRRCRCLATLLLFFTQEIDMWYPGRNPEGDTETVTGVSVGKGFWGRYLEIASRDPNRKKTWYRSPELRLRFYFKDPERVEALICEAMG
jgi:hypothetical protein